MLTERSPGNSLVHRSAVYLFFFYEGRRKEAHERTLDQQHRVPDLESFILDHSRLFSAKIYDSGGSLSTVWSAFRPISSSPPWKQVLKDVDH